MDEMITYNEPSEEQFREMESLQESYNGPIYMVNLFRYHPNGGRESFKKYEEFAKTFVQKKLKGELIYHGECLMTGVGFGNWDEVLIVKYPSIRLFMMMQKDKDYLKAKVHRMRSFKDWRLFLTREVQ